MLLTELFRVAFIAILAYFLVYKTDLIFSKQKSKK